MVDIAKKRIDAGLSQKDLSKALGISDAAVCQYEKGKREPNIEMLKKIAKVFNCTIDDLITNKNEES